VLDGPEFVYRQWQEGFLFPKTSRWSLVPTKPPIQCARGYFLGGVMLTTHLHVTPRLGMSGATPLLPYTPFWSGRGQLFLLHSQDEPQILVFLRVTLKMV